MPNYDNKSFSKYKMSFLSSINEFQGVFGVTLFSLLATIFTWGLVQSFKRDVLSPVLMAYIIPNKYGKDVVVKLSSSKTIELGLFVAEFMQWLVFMVLIFLGWRIYRRVKG